MTMYSMNVFRKKHKAFEHLLSNFVHSLSNILYIMGVVAATEAREEGEGRHGIQYAVFQSEAQ